MTKVYTPEEVAEMLISHIGYNDVMTEWDMRDLAGLISMSNIKLVDGNFPKLMDYIRPILKHLLYDDRADNPDEYCTCFRKTCVCTEVRVVRPTPPI